MGVDTKALLNGKIDVMTLAHDIVELYGAKHDEMVIRFKFDRDFYQIKFYQKNQPVFNRLDIDAVKTWRNHNHRMLNVFYDNKCDYAELTDADCTYLSLGCWGDSVEIMECLLKKHGGWIMRNDSTDEWELFA